MLLIVIDSGDDILLYVEAGRAWVEPALFEDMGNYIEYVDADDKIVESLYDLWELEDDDKKWIAMIYVVKGGKVDISFNYDGDFDLKESSIARSHGAVARNFGEKPIHYADYKGIPGSRP